MWTNKWTEIGRLINQSIHWLSGIPEFCSTNQIKQSSDEYSMSTPFHLAEPPDNGTPPGCHLQISNHPTRSHGQSDILRSERNRNRRFFPALWISTKDNHKTVSRVRGRIRRANEIVYRFGKKQKFLLSIHVKKECKSTKQPSTGRKNEPCESFFHFFCSWWRWLSDSPCFCWSNSRDTGHQSTADWMARWPVFPVSTTMPLRSTHKTKHLLARRGCPLAHRLSLTDESLLLLNIFLWNFWFDQTKPNISKLTEKSFEISCPSGQFGVGHLLAHWLATLSPHKQISSWIFFSTPKNSDL